MLLQLRRDVVARLAVLAFERFQQTVGLAIDVPAIRIM
jgi:hypothetical protein